jgi:dihydrofolate reductase
MSEVARAIISNISVPHGIYRVGNSTPWPSLNKIDKVIRKLTDGQVVVVGPITYSLLPKDLTYEMCIIVNHSNSEYCKGSFDYLLCENVNEAVALAIKRAPNKNIFFLGGDKVWSDALHLCTDMYITEVDCDCRIQNLSKGPLKFSPKLLSPNRLWMVDESLSFRENITTGNEEGSTSINLKYVHYKKLDDDLAERD